MPSLPSLIDVPPDRVGGTVQSFISNDGVKELEVRAQPNDNFTVTPLDREQRGPLLPPMLDVPPGQVGKTVQNFISNDGVQELEVVAQPDGNFIVTPIA